MTVEVLSVIRDADGEVQTAYSGDNIKLKLKGIEEEVSFLMERVNVYLECLFIVTL